MAGRIARFLDRWHLQKVRDRWDAVLDYVSGSDTFALRGVRTEARALRRKIDRVIHATDYRLALPVLGAGLPRTRLGTDWVWRPDAWRGPLPVPGTVADKDRTQVSDDLALYHDCPLGEILIRQSRNSVETDRAPFGLAIELFGFRGKFLSLATNLPGAAVQGLGTRHLIRLDAVIDADRPLKGFARLNVRHGPNLAQLVSGLTEDRREKFAEFDLAYAKIDESRIEKVWLDLIFNDAAMTRIAFRDMVLSRRPRAEM